MELTRRNIPFVKFGGLKFLEAAHIKDMLSFLRWAENPRDRVAGFRVIQLLPGAGPATAARVLERVGDRPDLVGALGDIKPPAAAAEHWPGFRRGGSPGPRQGGGLAGGTRPRSPLV